jgi:hypothetical protein
VIRKVQQHGLLSNISENNIRETLIGNRQRKRIIAQIHLLSGNASSRFDPQKSRVLSSVNGLKQWSLAPYCCTSDRNTIESAFSLRLKKEQHNTSQSRLFTGRGWGNISVIPLFDLPYHISGYFLINDTERADYSCIIKRIGPVHVKQAIFDAGYLSPRFIVKEDVNCVILTSTAVLAIEMQCKAEQQSGLPCNVLGWFPRNPKSQKRYKNNWNYFKDRRKIFWCHPADTDSLREACLCQADVSIAFFTDKNKPNCLLPKNKLTAQIIQEVQSTATAWTHALTNYLQAQQEHITDALTKLDVPRHILNQWLKSAPIDLRRVVETCLGALPASSRIVDNLIVEEREDGWWSLPKNDKSTPVQLSNIRCHIDKVINVINEEPIYQGRLLRNNREIPFTEPSAQFETNAGHKLASLWIDSNPEEYPVINVSKDRLLKLIHAYSRMEMVNVTKGIGWDCEKSLLRLPNILIGNGEVFPGHLGLNTLPFHVFHEQIPEPITTEDQQIAAIFSKDLAKITAVIAALTASLFSSAFRAEPPQTVVLSGGDKPVQHLFQLLALPSFSATQFKSAESYARVHRCPFFTIHTPDLRKAVNPFLPEYYETYRRAFISASLPVALARMCCGRANMLLLPQTAFYEWSSRKLQHLVRKIVFHCFIHLSRFVLKQIASTDCWNEAVIEETFQLIQDKLGVAQPDRHILLTGYDADGRYLIDLISLLRRIERLNIRDVQETDNELIVSCDALRTQFRTLIGYFDLQPLLNSLQQTDLFKEYRTADDTLVFPKEPFTRSLRRIETLYGSFIRLR